MNKYYRSAITIYPGMNESKSDMLISRYLAGEISEAEQKELKAWINASAENRHAFEEAVAIWQKIERPEPPSTPPFNEFWAEMEDHLQADASDAVPSKQIRKQRAASFAAHSPGKIRARWLLATAALLAIGAFFVLPILMNSDDIVRYQTRNAQQLTVNLSDGSTVELSAASDLHFVENERERIAYLSGQAFFRIRTDSRPFRVVTYNATITVLGTRFDVRTYDRQTRVSVEEGRVAFAAHAHVSHPLRLSAGRMSSVRGSDLPSPPTEIKVVDVAGWRNGVLHFRDMPLQYVVEDLQRRYDVNIRFEDPDLTTLKMNATFANQDISSILDEIGLIFQLRYELVDGQYVLSR